MEIAKDIPDLYPDLIEHDGLANAVQAALCMIGSSLSVSEPDKSVSFVVYARVESGHRFSQIYIGAKTRIFSFDFWNPGSAARVGPVLSDSRLDCGLTESLQRGERNDHKSQSFCTFPGSWNPTADLVAGTSQQYQP